MVWSSNGTCILQFSCFTYLWGVASHVLYVTLWYMHLYLIYIMNIFVLWSPFVLHIVLCAIEVLQLSYIFGLGLGGYTSGDVMWILCDSWGFHSLDKSLIYYTRDSHKIHFTLVEWFTWSWFIFPLLGSVIHAWFTFSRGRRARARRPDSAFSQIYLYC